MAIKYEPSEHAYYTEGESLTETEHLESTDANVMIKRAARGLPITTAEPGLYGYDTLS